MALDFSRFFTLGALLALSGCAAVGELQPQQPDHGAAQSRSVGDLLVRRLEFDGADRTSGIFRIVGGQRATGRIEVWLLGVDSPTAFTVGVIDVDYGRPVDPAADPSERDRRALRRSLRLFPVDLQTTHSLEVGGISITFLKLDGVTLRYIVN